MPRPRGRSRGPARVTESTQPRRAPDARHSFTRASAVTSNSWSTPRDRGRVEAAERLDRGFAHLAEERPAEVDGDDAAS